jgi:integrase
MVALLMDLRASEIVRRYARDVDDDGRLLWIPSSKTKAGRRTVEIPEVIRPYLLKLAEGKKPEALVFGHHTRNWPRHWTKRICRLAGIPEVTVHGLRGTHASLATEHGATGHVVAAALGHSSPSVSFRSYTREEAAQVGRQRRALTVLTGGGR